MKDIAIISTSNNDSLNKVVGLCQITLEDMGARVTKFDLNEDVDILQEISGVGGLIIATDMRINNIPAKLQAFFELVENENILKGMPVLPVIISSKYSTLDGYKIILNNLIQLDCIEAGKIINSSQHLKKSFIELQTKNLYESIEERKLDGQKARKAENKNVSKDQLSMRLEDFEAQENIEKEEILIPRQVHAIPSSVKNAYTSAKPDTKIKNKPEDDIMELTELFSKQLSKKIGSDVSSIMNTGKAAFENQVTVRQMTKNLVHYFQPQLADGMENTYQLNIIGDEEFNGYLEIKDKDCEYKDGEAPKADVIVNVDSGMWKLILVGSISAQKAFMTGKVKVKGDFMLLAKFDKIFKKM